MALAVVTPKASAEPGWRQSARHASGAVALHACQITPTRRISVNPCHVKLVSLCATAAVVAPVTLKRRRCLFWRGRLASRASKLGGDNADGGLEVVSRRGAFALACTIAAASTADATLRATSEQYALAGSILAPSPFKETLRTELVPGQIWGFEQVIAFSTVSANIRMTVVRMLDGRLWVSGPLAPTRQLLQLLDELGEVVHLVVAGTALEHKASINEFRRIYPNASVWVAPGQNATPLDLPIGPVEGVLGQGEVPPWQQEIDFKVFYVAPPETQGTYSEVAFFHRASKTLLATDAVLKVPRSAPQILASYGYDGTPCELSDSQWQYKFLAFNFLTMRGSNEADLASLAQPPAVVSPLLRFTLYPICQSAAAAWVQDVATWPFEQAVAGHLESPFPLGPNEFLEAFGFLFNKPSSWEPGPGQLVDLRTLSEQLDGPSALQSRIWTAAAASS